MVCKLCAREIEKGAKALALFLGVCEEGAHTILGFLATDFIAHAHVECFEEKYDVSICEL